MNQYEVEIIFEPTGDYMTFIYEAESETDEALFNEIVQGLSVVSSKVVE